MKSKEQNYENKIRKSIKSTLIYIILIVIFNSLYCVYLLFFLHNYWSLLGLASGTCFSILTAKFTKIMDYVIEYLNDHEVEE